MRNLFRAGVGLMILGTLVDLVYHALTEPEEIFPREHPVELGDHLLIMAGVGLLVLGGIVAAMKDGD